MNQTFDLKVINFVSENNQVIFNELKCKVQNKDMLLLVIMTMATMVMIINDDESNST